MSSLVYDSTTTTNVTYTGSNTSTALDSYYSSAYSTAQMLHQVDLIKASISIPTSSAIRASDILSDANGGSLNNISNPYQERILVDAFLRSKIKMVAGRPVNNGYEIYYKYADNQAYYDFENQVAQAQRMDLAAKSSAAGTNAKFTDFKLLPVDFGGNGVEVDNAIKSIEDATSQIAEAQYIIDNIGNYDKLTATDIQELKNKISELEALRDNAIEIYQKGYAEAFKEKMDFLRKQQGTGDTWKTLNLVWLQGQGYGVPLGSLFNTYSAPMNDIEMQGYTTDYIGGKMSHWMAGGYLYDSPRAGDVMFNVTGDLNTTVFMGIRSNNNTHWTGISEGRLGELNQKTFKNLAGEEFFSIKPQI